MSGAGVCAANWNKQHAVNAVKSSRRSKPNGRCSLRACRTEDAQKSASGDSYLSPEVVVVPAVVHAALLPHRKPSAGSCNRMGNTQSKWRQLSHVRVLVVGAQHRATLHDYSSCECWRDDQ